MIPNTPHTKPMIQVILLGAEGEEFAIANGCGLSE